MRQIVIEVLTEARDTQPGPARGRAQKLAEAMSPLLGHELYTNKKISAWINGHIGNIPAEGVLAAAQASGISLDARLGLGGKEPAIDQRLREIDAKADEAIRRSAAAEEMIKRFRRWDAEHPERDAS